MISNFLQPYRRVVFHQKDNVVHPADFIGGHQPSRPVLYRAGNWLRDACAQINARRLHRLLAQLIADLTDRSDGSGYG